MGKWNKWSKKYYLWLLVCCWSPGWLSVIGRWTAIIFIWLFWWCCCQCFFTIYYFWTVGGSAGRRFLRGLFLRRRPFLSAHPCSGQEYSKPLAWGLRCQQSKAWRMLWKAGSFQLMLIHMPWMVMVGSVDSCRTCFFIRRRFYDCWASLW